MMSVPLFVWPGIAAMICFIGAAVVAIRKKFKYHKLLAYAGIILAVVHMAMAFMGVY